MTARETFWSRRKKSVEAEARQERALNLAREEAHRQAAQDQKSDEDLLKELGLPDPDSLLAGDDFSVFMAKAVPARLRTRALRRLWRSNPILANLDDLVDYGDDFTDAGLSGVALQTSYKVGGGLRRHVEELARQRPHDGPVQVDEDTPADDDDAAEMAETAVAPETEAPETSAAAPKRRMRFVAGAPEPGGRDAG